VVSQVAHYGGTRLFAYRATIAGRQYHGRGQGEGMCIVLRETAASRRNRKESGK